MVQSVLEGRIRGRKESGRPKQCFLDWLLNNDDGNIDYDQLKMMAEDRLSLLQLERKPA